MGDLVRLFPVVDGSRALGRRKGFRRGVSAAVLFERAAALESSEPARAAAAYARALGGSPGLADAHCNLGRLLHEAGDVATAELHYRLALCADRTVALYWFNLGVALEDMGRNAEAIAAYREAVGCDPQLADAHYNLAGILHRAGDLRSTREAFRHLHAYRALRRAS
jgi:tetratricopeptide (TPR) repeat protein